MQLERIEWALTAAWVMAAVIVGLFVRDLTWQIWAAPTMSETIKRRTPEDLAILSPESSP